MARRGLKVVFSNFASGKLPSARSEEHTSELQSRQYLVCRLLLEKKKAQNIPPPAQSHRQVVLAPIPSLDCRQTPLTNTALSSRLTLRSKCCPLGTERGLRRIWRR